MKFHGLLAIASLLLFTQCQSSNQETTHSEPNLPGSDRDSHDCIRSAGYTWSAVKKECIRVFESGVRLNAAAGQDSTMSAFIVFGADSSQVEVFFPNQAPVPVLSRSESQTTWEDEQLTISHQAGKWVIQQGGKPIYQE
ncbi:hypothetical protein [Arsenicibacter rosenii]|uniref:Lipoprotein n=1 Tax=Arsenicibacter rosenii TaxID=1750698 RepID=A0A1S2VBV6_9BACT|nr:hypothetical protein [Arsenicibacter rosenii]OIN56237.1 hypothetical protein BLX24_25915 [Arsenicibacter rosenii]